MPKNTDNSVTWTRTSTPNDMNKAQLLTHLIEIQEESDEEFEIITGFHGDKTIKIVFK